MKQDKVKENKRKFAEKPLELTRSALEKSQRATAKSMELTHSIIKKSMKMRTLSARIDQFGTAVCGFACAGCIGVGVLQIFSGKPLWAAGTLSLGAVALISNRIHYHQMAEAARSQVEKPDILGISDI